MNSPWQPIETAPKDHSAVFVTEKGSAYLPRTAFWEEPGGWYEALTGRPLRTPTHWMPIPKLEVE
jgi:hypothetical protein